MLNKSTISWTRTIVTGFILLVGLQSAARADINAYMITVSADFGKLDLNTGVYTSIGPTVAVAGTFPGTRSLAGIGEIGSTLYGVCEGCGEEALYTIDPTTGSLTQVGIDGSYIPVGFGSTLTGLYAVDFSKNLYSVNPVTGAAHFIGSTGVATGSDYTLSTNSGTLYFASAAELYTLNLTTGLATLVGPTGGPQFGGLVTEGSVLYGGEYPLPKEVDTLNTGTGAAASQVPPAPLTGTTSDFAGLAAIPATSSVPEPRTVSWLLLGLLAGAGWIKTRSDRQRLQPNNRTTE
jgi:hypothetical protein